MTVQSLYSTRSLYKIKFVCTILGITAAVLLYNTLVLEHDRLFTTLPSDNNMNSLKGKSDVHDNNKQQHNNIKNAPPQQQALQVLPHDYIYQSSWGAAPIVMEDHKLIFFWVTKAGCTTFKTLFRRMMGYDDWKTNLNVHYPQSNGLKYLHQYSLQEATSMMLDPDYTRAMIVRDPKERFLSAYLDKAVARNGSFVRLACCPKTNKQCWPSSASNDNQTLQDFFELTRECHNPHWNPQGYRIDPKFLTTLNFVGHLSNITAAAQDLLQTIGAWEDYGKSGWGQYRNESIFASRNTLSASHKTSQSTEDAWENLLPKYYTVELEAAVEERYAIDYTTPEFGLPRRKIVFYNHT